MISGFISVLSVLFVIQQRSGFGRARLTWGQGQINYYCFLRPLSIGCSIKTGVARFLRPQHKINDPTREPNKS